MILILLICDLVDKNCFNVRYDNKTLFLNKIPGVQASTGVGLPLPHRCTVTPVGLAFQLKEAYRDIFEEGK